MKGYDEEWERAASRVPFSNGTAWDMWAFRWCEQCVNDGMGGTDPDGKPWCPLITVALAGRTPAQWTEKTPPLQDYECSEFSACQE